MKPTDTPGVSALVREAAMDLGHLLGQHAKVAQLELKAELHAMGRRASIIAVLAALVAVGYALAMAGLAMAIGGHLTVGLPLVVESKHSLTNRFLGTLGTFGIGLLVGAGVALLLAPKPGRELRHDLRTKLHCDGDARASTPTASDTAGA